MTASQLNILIIGGGLGGLCLAQRLKAAGVRVAVYERHPPNFWPKGYLVHVNPVGSRALHTCLPPPLWQLFVALAGTPPAGIGFLTEQLGQLVVVGKDFMSTPGDSAVEGHYPINRVALRQLLLAGLEQDVHYHKTFEHYTQHAGGRVTAHFSDGTSATGDLLVGADGPTSRVRHQLLPHAQRITAAVGIGGKLALTDATRAWLPPALLARMNLVRARCGPTLFTAAFDRPPASNGRLRRIEAAAHAAGLDPAALIDTAQDYLLWALIAPAQAQLPEPRCTDGERLRALVGQQTAGWHPALRRLVAESDPASIMQYPIKAAVGVSPWTSSTVTLLGDAIHHMPPLGGLGGNMALHDASVLARLLIAAQQGERPLPVAVQLYEQEMRACGFAAVRTARGHIARALGGRLSALATRAWLQSCALIPPLRRILEQQWTRPMRPVGSFEF